jgi:peptidoglycan/LPS O-acetylase OafA/YrhL
MTSDRDSHIPSLDGIRGVAALLVFFSHLELQHIDPGGFGVTIFFFLSGYLITTLLRREFEQTADISFKRFYLRRFYRIFPPMYLFLAVVVLLTFIGIFPNDMSWVGVLALLAQLTNYYVLFAGDQLSPHTITHTGAMWSLAVEEHFYLIFPVTLLFLLRRFSYRRIALILLSTCALVLLWRYFLVLVIHARSQYIYTATDTRLDSLLFGCIMGVWWNPALDNDVRAIGRTGWMVLFALGVGLLFASFFSRSGVFHDTLRYTTLEVALYPMFYCAVRFSSWPIFSWLEFKPVRALGTISYSFYLSQLPALKISEKYAGRNEVVIAVVGLFISLAFSAAMYYFVERHMTALRRKLHPSFVPLPDQKVSTQEIKK